MGEKYHFEKDRGYVNGKQTRGWVISWKVKDRELYDAFVEPDVSALKAV
jgi:hypothetical protein